MMPLHDHPLFRIGDEALLRRFVEFPADADEDAVVAAVCGAFARMPYENLTKIIRRDAVIGLSSARRLPDEVIADHLAHGTGGTCFSLTAALIAVLGRSGVEAYPMLADRRYGTDTHCAVLVVMGSRPHVVDPGYLIHRPIPIPERDPLVVDSRFNRIELAPEGAGRVALYTRSGGDRRYRLAYKTTPVDGDVFGAAWDRSFGWEMMTYPVLTRTTATEHHYLQGGELRIRRGDRTVRERLDREGCGRFLAGSVGMAPHIVEQALRLVAYGASRPG